MYIMGMEKEDVIHESSRDLLGIKASDMVFLAVLLAAGLAIALAF
jgi:hypothetical protein